MNKKEFVIPSVEVMTFDKTDVIATSGCSGTQTEQNNEVLGEGGCTSSSSGDMDSVMAVDDTW